MTEEEKRIREQIVERLYANGYRPWDGCRTLADQILCTDGIEIRSKDQSLPSVRNAVNKSYNDYMLGQEDMLKAGFVKVIPKGR